MFWGAINHAHTRQQTIYVIYAPPTGYTPTYPQPRGPRKVPVLRTRTSGGAWSWILRLAWCGPQSRRRAEWGPSRDRDGPTGTWSWSCLSAPHCACARLSARAGRLVPVCAQSARPQSHSSCEQSLNAAGLTEWTPVCREPRISWGPGSLTVRRQRPDPRALG